MGRSAARLALLGLFAFWGLNGGLLGEPAISASSAIVASVYDGDTLTLTSGAKVRLVQIDTPELRPRECYGPQAASALRQLLPPGTAVTLARDPKLDERDRYGRLLRYVFRGKLHVNLALVERGAAAPYFYGGERGRHASALLRAQRRAEAQQRGMWRACRVSWRPDAAVETAPR